MGEQIKIKVSESRVYSIDKKIKEKYNLKPGQEIVFETDQGRVIARIN